MTLEERIYSNEYADLIVRSFYLDPFRNPPPEISGNFYELNTQFSALFLQRDLLPENMFGDIPYRSVPKLYTVMSTVSLEDSGILQVQTQPSLQLTGNGVVIGIADTGIDYTHPAFRKADGTTRIIRIWDQTERGGTSPKLFPYGTEYTEEEINEALKLENPFDKIPVNDPEGHGTFVAGTAAGSSDEFQGFIGAAPDAEIIVVKLKPAKQYLRDFFYISGSAPVFQENDILSGIRYLTETADRLKKPLVICMALGSNQGSRTASLPLPLTLERLGQIQGITPVIAAGNEAGRFHHCSGSVSSQDSPSNVEILVPKGSSGFTMELWGQVPQLFSVGFRSPAGETIPRIPVTLSAESRIPFILEQTVIYLKYDIVTESGQQLIIIRFENPTEGIWNLQIFGSQEIRREYNVWLPVTGLSDPDITFLTPDPYKTITNPSSPESVITTGAYQASTQSLYVHSGRGYTAENSIKPDFVSPGVDVTGPGPSGTYLEKSGTSAAAALASGAAALLIQWGLQQTPPVYFTTRQLKIYLIRGARRDADLTYPNREWGYGILDLYNSFLSMMTT